MAPIVAGLESGDLVQYLKDSPKFDSRYGELEVNSSGSISTPIVLKVIKAGWVAPFEEDCSYQPLAVLLQSHSKFPYRICFRAYVFLPWRLCRRLPV